MPYLSRDEVILRGSGTKEYELQARGCIFPPFADDDPKTAEIMSKILLLAEDQKIKDPSILGQITG